MRRIFKVLSNLAAFVPAMVAATALAYASASPLGDCLGDGAGDTAFTACGRIVHATVASDEDRVAATLRLSHLLRERGMHDRALDLVSESLANVSLAYGAILWREAGDIHVERGGYAAAIEAYGHALMNGGESADILHLRGWAHVRAGNVTEAEGDFLRVLELDAASCFQGLQDAMASCQRVIESAAAEPETRTEAHHWKGEYLQYSAHLPREAVEEYGYALELDPDHVPSLLGRAEALVSLEENREALGDLDHAISVGADWTAHLTRARVRRLLGDIEGAMADFRSVLDQNPTHSGARDSLAALNSLR